MRTQRLTLRQWDPDNDGDVEAAFDIYRRAEVAGWLSHPAKPWESLLATRDRLRRWAGVAEEHPGLGLWAVVPDQEPRPVGTVLLVRLPGAGGVLTDDVEIGWHFHPQHWGRGYATEAARAVLHYAFAHQGLQVVNALAFDGNDASFDVMERLGMTQRGRTSRWYDTTFEWWTIESPH